MGFMVNSTRFLLYTRDHGVSFERTATIGRQQLFLDPASLQNVLTEFGFDTTIEESTRLLARGGGYAEPLLELLGAKVTRSFDASDYEGATDVHDFNVPISSDFHASFDLVLDGGSLEHVFNVSVAMRNLMMMVKLGGHLVMISPANNFFGHGFYQFSPEFFYRALSPENGFQLKRLLVFEDIKDPDWFEVVDPAAVGRRVTVLTKRPMFLAMIARRSASVPVFATMPQESDYVEIWRDRPENPTERTVDRLPSVIDRLKARTPALVKSAYRLARKPAARRRYAHDTFRRTGLR
jgi:SAM-dependent methyltransferase